MKGGISVSLSLLATSLGMSTFGAIPDLLEYPGTLVVNVPYRSLLWGEIFHAKLVVENRGGEDIQIVGEGLNDMLQLVWIHVANGEATKGPGRVPGVGGYNESPVETFSDQSLEIHPSFMLAPGASYSSDRLLVSSLGQSLPYVPGTHEYRTAFYVGKGRVIYGKDLSFEVIPKPLTSFEVVHEAVYTLGGNSELPLTIYEVPLGSESYLFDGTGYRFCRIPPGVGYRITFLQQGRGRETTVTFDDATLEPLVFRWENYDLVSASNATVPWLFADGSQPSPGGAGSVPEGARTSQDGEPGAGVPPATPATASPGDPDRGSRWWLWTAVLACLVLVAAWWWKRRPA